MKSKKQRSTKQLWVSERLFRHAGYLKCMITKLEIIKDAKSTLPIEFDYIKRCIDNLKKLKMSDRKVKSFEIYKERSEKDES